MALHGLKVEKDLGGGNWDEKQGMIDFYAEFNSQYDNYINDGTGKSDEQGLVDAVFIKFVQSGSGYRVTYSSDNGGGNPQLMTVSHGTLDPPIKAVRDKASAKKFHMVVPSLKPDFSEGYVSNIITKVGGAASDPNEKYLLGTILMRKCR